MEVVAKDQHSSRRIGTPNAAAQNKKSARRSRRIGPCRIVGRGTWQTVAEAEL